MSKRTQISQVPTNFTEKQPEGASSCIINRKRQMFQSLTGTNIQSVNMKNVVEQNGSKLLPKNVLIMNPNHIRSIVWPQVFMPDQEITVNVKGNFYSFKDRRNKQRFINRNSMPNSQIMYFNVYKNGDKLIISSVEKFLINNEGNKADQLWYHFDVAIFNLETQSFDRFGSVQKGYAEVSSAKTAKNLSAKVGQIYYLQFKGMQLIDNHKKAFVVFEPIGLERNRYEVIMIDFEKTNHSESVGSFTQLAENKKFGRQGLQVKKVGAIHLQRKETQNYKKLINSQFGDIVLLVTSHQIYQIQIAGQMRHNEYTLILKPFLVCKIFAQNKNTYVSNQTNQLVLSKEIFSKEENIIDAEYVMNGLKIMILTSHGRIFVVESQQCIFSESLYEMLSNKQMVQNYNIEYFVFKTIYFLRGLLVVEVQAEKKQDCNLLRQIKHEQSILEKLDEKKNMFEYVSRGLIIAKVQSNSLSFSKFISLPFQLKDYGYLKVHPFRESDELLIQVMALKDPEILELHRCQIISNKNNFIPFSLQHCIQEPKICVNTDKLSTSITRQVDSKRFSKVNFGKSHKCFFVLKGNELSGYRIYENEFVSVLKNGIQKTLSAVFFQKPHKIITNPLTGQVVILYREFIKFFMSVYSELKLLFVMNIREVKDISFSKYGQYLMLCMNDNSIHKIDSYRLTEHKIMDFYNQVKEVHHASEYILIIKTSKNVLHIYRKKEKPAWGNSGKNGAQVLEHYDKLYELKLQAEDLYHSDQTYTVVMKKDGSVEFYSHVPVKRNAKNISDQKQTLILSILQKQHPNLVNRKMLVFEKSQIATYCFYSSQFSTLFVGTNFGNIRQYLYPFLSIEDPSPPQCYNYSASNSAIIHIQINADFSSMFLVTESGQILQLKYDQFLNGIKKNGIYVLSKTQTTEHELKYQFANRNYLIDDFTTVNDQIKRTIEQNYEETCFADDKIKNDIEDVTNKIKTQSAKTINKLSSQKKNVQQTFKTEFGQMSSQLKDQQKSVIQNLENLKTAHQKTKDQMVQNHEKQLLQIYRQNDRLTNIMKTKAKEFTNTVIELKQQLGEILQQQMKFKQSETIRLQKQYQELNDKYNMYSKVSSQQINQNQNELQTFKLQQITKFQSKLKEEELKKEAQLSRTGKIQKEIERFKKRSIYFENLIVQTRNQIEQLHSDVDLYNDKKNSLIKELEEKELTIQEKQTQIVKYLKTTSEMKKVKNVHEFQLTQFQGDIIPIQQKIYQLEKQVQKMNTEIMEQFNSKVEQDSFIDSSHKRIEKLKNKNQIMIQNTLKTKSKLLRFSEALSAVLQNDPFAHNIKQKLFKVIDAFSKQNENFVPNEQLQRGKKQGLDLMRKKNMLSKAIQRQQKLEEGVVRNKNQFFKFYSDNTNLVKEYNELFKDHNVLIQEKIVLQQKIANLKAGNFKTPMKRTASLHIRKVSEKKLTPFQRYEQDHVQFNTIKLKDQDTTETRLSRGSSTSFLKSLIKDVSIAQSNYQKSNLIRDRIRTFVNPQMQRKKDVQKQLFLKERERGKSNYVPLLKL